MNRLRGFNDGARRVAGFASTAAVSALVNIAVVPVVIRQLGTVAWSNVAIGQTSGALLGVIVALGWGVVGPSDVASRDPASRPDYFVASVGPRVMALMVLTVPLCVWCCLIVSEARLATCLVSVAGAMYGVGAAWYFVGDSDPGRLMLLDTIPKVSGTCVAAGVVLLGGGLLAFSILVLAGSVAGPILSTVSIAQRSAARFRVRLPVASRRVQFHALWIGMTSAVYLNSATLAVAMLAPRATASYALGDRLFKLAIFGVLPVMQVIQGWLPARGPDEVRPRALRLTPFVVAGAVIAGPVLAVVMAPVSERISGGSVSLGFGVTTGFGVAFAASLGSQFVGSACLVAMSASRQVAVSASVGASVALVLFVLLIPAGAAAGGAWALAAAEVTVLSWQAVALMRILRQPNPSPPASDLMARQRDVN